MKSVILLENDNVMRQALIGVIGELSSLKLIGISATSAGGFELLNQRPDFALVDLMLDDGLAYDFISEASEKHSTKILIVSVLGDERSVISAIQAGAVGYVKKDATSVELSNAISAVLRGETPMSPTIARHLLRRIQSGTPTSSKNGTSKCAMLSPREKQILESLAHGMNYKEVARKYELSHHTVAKYIKTVYKKLSVNSRAEAVVAAMRSGIISIDED